MKIIENEEQVEKQKPIEEFKPVVEERIKTPSKVHRPYDSLSNYFFQLFI